MKFELQPHHHNVSDDELLSDLRAVADRFPNQPITHALYNQHGRFHSATIFYRFGTWRNALAKIGRRPAHHYRVPTGELFANLESVWRQLGRQPRQIDMQPPLSAYGVSTYARRFGGYHKALAAFVAAVEARCASEPSDAVASPPPVAAVVPRSSRTITWRLRFLAFQRDGFRCRACGRSPANEPGTKLHVDHIVPWASGGETTLDNLQCLCERCNGGKSDLPWQASTGDKSGSAL
jgi:hypothetical protein